MISASPARAGICIFVVTGSAEILRGFTFRDLVAENIS
jgi:hypothetical protein